MRQTVPSSSLSPGIDRLLLWLAFGLFVIGAIPCSFAAEVTKLSLIKDSEFPQWLVGAEWEFSPASGKTRKLWFPTSDVVICARSEEKQEKVECGYSFIIQKKGVVRCFADTSGKRTMELTLAEDTAKGMVKDSDTGKSYPLKFIGRRSLPAEPKKTKDEFATWLKGKSVSNAGTNSFSFDSDSTVLVSGKESKQFKFEILRPGLVKYLYAGNPYDPKLIAFSPDLKTVRSWAWWGTFESPVTNREPPAPAAPAATTDKNPEVKKSEPFSMPDMKEIPVAARSATVQTLLVEDLGNSRYAGKPSTLSLSARPFDGAKPATVAFNGEVGSVMEKSLNEMARFEALRHGGWPRAHHVQLSFDDEVTPRDGSSAAVACALLLESAFKGLTVDPDFAVTGEMNADGSVQPVAGVHAKLRGAANFKCRLLAIPARNAVHATDLVLTEGLRPFLSIQVFSIASFEEALALARFVKTPELTAAIEDFAVLAKTVGTTPQSLRTPTAAGKLKNILQRAPGHLSAQILLQYASNNLPKSLSPAGSFAELDQTIGDLGAAIGDDPASTGKLNSGQVSKARLGLQRLRTLADARVRPLVDAWVNWGGLADRLAKGKDAPTKKDVEEWSAARARIRVEDEKLRSNGILREDLK